MIKLFELWTRRPDMTHEEAVRHWTEVHRELLLPHVRSLDIWETVYLQVFNRLLTAFVEKVAF